MLCRFAGSRATSGFGEGASVKGSPFGTAAGAGVPSDGIGAFALAEAVRDSMAEHAASAGVRLLAERDNSGSTADLAVIGSATALRRAVTSLVDNALAHENDGGWIVIRVARRGPDVVIDVRDDGVGVDFDAVETLFTRSRTARVSLARCSHVRVATADRQEHCDRCAVTKAMALTERLQYCVV